MNKDQLNQIEFAAESILDLIDYRPHYDEEEWKDLVCAEAETVLRNLGKRIEVQTKRRESKRIDDFKAVKQKIKNLLYPSGFKLVEIRKLAEFTSDGSDIVSVTIAGAEDNQLRMDLEEDLIRKVPEANEIWINFKEED